MIQDIIDKYTPHIVNGKKLYEEKDVLQMMERLNAQTTQKMFTYTYEDHTDYDTPQQYPEASC